jgi:hypothetical protein
MKKQIKKPVAPKITKEEQLLLNFLKENKLQLKLNKQMTHTNQQLAQAYLIIGNALGINMPVSISVVKEGKAKK